MVHNTAGRYYIFSNFVSPQKSLGNGRDAGNVPRSLVRQTTLGRWLAQLSRWVTKQHQKPFSFFSLRRPKACEATKFQAFRAIACRDGRPAASACAAAAAARLCRRLCPLFTYTLHRRRAWSHRHPLKGIPKKASIGISRATRGLVPWLADISTRLHLTTCLLSQEAGDEPLEWTLHV